MCVVSCKAVLNYVYLKPISATPIPSMIDGCRLTHMQGRVHAKQQVSGHNILLSILQQQYDLCIFTGPTGMDMHRCHASTIAPLLVYTSQ